MLDPDISTHDALRHLHRAENPYDLAGMDRRRFLQLVGMGVGAGLVASGSSSLLDMHIPGLDPSAWATGPIGPTDGILVVIGMYGGNDGLNTVVPIDDARYHEQHAPVAIDGGDTLPLDADSGLHENLTVLKQFWDAGQLAIVEGVGHGVDEFSHFSSMAMWMAGRAGGVPDSGWLGRWLDAHLDGRHDLYSAAEIGSGVPLHMIGTRSAAATVPVGQPRFGVARDDGDQALFDAIRSFGIGDVSTQGSTVGAPSWLGMVGRAQSDQLDLAARLDPLLPTEDEMPETEIAAKLDIAARLINANLGMRVLTAGFGDFDSHAGQPGQHGARMAELNAALGTFFARLGPQWTNRVTVATFSEFGRTSHANDSAGTDHGSSAPHFVLGANVRGGFYGERPSLAGLREWDRMPTNVRHLDYYASLIGPWLGGDPAEIVPGFSEDLHLFSAGPGAGGSSVPDTSGTFPPPPAAPIARFVGINPQRIFDSRDETRGTPARLGAGETVTVRVADVAGVPAGVKAVAVNITAIRPTEDGAYLAAYPTGQPRPDTATLNPRQGSIMANMSVVGVGDDGSFELFNYTGDVHATVDLMGYFDTSSEARMHAVNPDRILDTRSGIGAPKARVRAGEVLQLEVTGRGGIPATGADSVVLNLTSINPTSGGWVTVWPAGSAKGEVANLTYVAGDIVPNMVICKIGDGGMINLEVSHGDLDLTADVTGCFADSGTTLAAMRPARLLDTRTGDGAPANPVGAGAVLDVQVTGRGGVPAGASAVVLNITGIRPTQRTYLTVFPTGSSRPTAANLNPAAGAVAGNLVVAKIGDGGKVSIYNDVGALHLAADVTAYFA